MSGAMLFGGIFLGLAVLINFMFIVNKFEKGRFMDAIVDIFIILIASAIYGSSIMGGVIATIGSMFISIYLHYVPLKFFQKKPKQASEKSTASKWADRFDDMFK